MLSALCWVRVNQLFYLSCAYRRLVGLFLVCSILFASCPHRPDDSCHLVSQRYRRNVVVFVLLDVSGPLLQPSYFFSVASFSVRTERKYLSPRLLIRPSTRLLPELNSLGVKPSQELNCRARLN